MNLVVYLLDVYGLMSTVYNLVLFRFTVVVSNNEAHARSHTLDWIRNEVDSGSRVYERNKE